MKLENLTLVTSHLTHQQMIDIHFTNIEMFLLLWLLPVIGLLYVYAAGRRKKAMAAFITPEILKKTPSSSPSPKRGRRLVLLCLCLSFLTISLARPAWNLSETTVKRSGRDVVFMVDVSKSMLATDLKPNRLERAKLAIQDCIEKLQGDRVALVAFSGTASVRCPLTQDYGFFLMMLDSISTTSTGRGGTLIGDALRTTVNQVFDNQEKQHKDIILITDGEDHESFPEEAARNAGETGIRLLIIGLGDEKEGRRIPIVTADGKTSFLKYNGQEVWTKLDGTTLRNMALATPGGRYLPVATGTLDLGEVYLDLIASADQKELESKTIKRYEEKFQIFLAVSLIFLMAESLVGRSLFIIIFLLLPLLGPDPTLASSRGLILSGNKAYEKGNFVEAEKFYTDALSKDPQKQEALFNKGDSLYRQGKFAQAEKDFDQSLAAGGEKDLLAKSWFNKGNSRFRTAEQKTDLKEQLTDMQESSTFFQKAFQLDNTFTEAGRNLEISRRKIKEIEQKLEEQQQQDQGQDQEKQQNEQQEKEQQRKQQENTQGEESQPADNKQQGEQKEQQQPEDKNPQSDPNNETEGSQDQQQQQQQQSEADQQKDNQQQGDEKAAQKLELSDKTVEEILEAEKKLQEMRRERMRISPNSVEKDW